MLVTIILIRILTMALFKGMGGTYNPGNLSQKTYLSKKNSLYLLNISNGPSLSTPYKSIICHYYATYINCIENVILALCLVMAADWVQGSCFIIPISFYHRELPLHLVEDGLIWEEFLRECILHFVLKGQTTSCSLHGDVICSLVHFGLWVAKLIQQVHIFLIST